MINHDSEVLITVLGTFVGRVSIILLRTANISHIKHAAFLTNKVENIADKKSVNTNDHPIK